MKIVGFCGATGDLEHQVDEISQRLFFYGNESSSKYSDEDIEIEIVPLQNSFEDQPLISEDGTHIWMWGRLYGCEKNKEVLSKYKNDFLGIKYFYEQYKKHGFEFLKDINGEFAAIVYSKNNNILSLISDPLATHPIFYTKTKDGELIFSTNLQSLPFYPSVKTSFDLKYLYQFFTFERVLGVKTPLKGIEQISPGSILTFDLRSKEIRKKTYWKPRYEPIDRSHTEVVNEFTKLFREVIKERVKGDYSYGIFLSGGSDSRLILAMLKEVYPELDIVCYHMNERMNKEAKIAKKVAKKCGCEFKLLKREDNYLEKVLEAYSPISIYNGWFDQAHSIGFVQDIKDEVDVVFNGLNAGTILQRGHLPKKSLKIPFIEEKMYFPKFPNFQSLKDFVNFYIEEGRSTSREINIPIYLKGLEKKEFIQSFRSEFKGDERQIECHGVKYPSFEDFFHSFSFYPITNDQGFIAFHSEINSILTEFPFMDKRIVEFSLSLPEKELLKNHIVNSSIKRINNSLANIEHAGTGLPLRYPGNIHFLKKQINVAKCKLFPSQKEQGPWGNTEEIIRKHDFVKNKIYDHEDLIKTSDFLDWDDIINCYNQHMVGKNNKNELFALLTFLENSTTEKLLKKQR